MTPEQKKRIYELARLIENEKDATKLKMYNAELEKLIDLELDEVHMARRFATIRDTTGCEHKFIVGPQRVIKTSTWDTAMNAIGKLQSNWMTERVGRANLGLSNMMNQIRNRW